MSAGAGITHSEFNASTHELVHFLQMWVPPDVQGVTPGYQEIDVQQELATGALVKVAGGGDDAASEISGPAGRRRNHASRSTACSPPFLHPRVDAPDLRDEPLPVRVLEVEDLGQGPVEVVRDVRDLLEHPLGPVRRYSPGADRPEMSTPNSCPQLGQATAARVWPSALTRR